MMYNPTNEALVFLIQTIFDLYLFVLMIRILLVYINAHYFDPLTYFIRRLTDSFINPIRKILPNIGRFETASIVLVFVLEIIKYLILVIIKTGSAPFIGGLLILALGDFLRLILQTFFFAILIYAILTWVQPYSPLTRTLYQLTSPVMNPFRRIIPPIGGIDLSAIAALIVLQLLSILIVNPLMVMGGNLI